MIGRFLSGFGSSFGAIRGFSAAAAAMLALGAAACTPQIGNSCTLNTDCSIDNSRQCDNSQPNGYCTVFNCAPNTCPNNAVCVELQANVPGCPYDDYASPSRGARSMCLKPCNHSSDCRQSDGYSCVLVSSFRDAGVEAVILDNSPQSESVCAVAPDLGLSATGSLGDAAPVCPGGPVPEAGAIPTPDSGADAADAAADAGSDAAVDATVADAPAPADAAPEGAEDATEDGPADATVDGGDGAADSSAGG
jgi:hypothetical protein